MEEAASQQSIYRLQSIDNQFSYSCVLAALAPGPTQYPEEGRSQAKRASPTFPAAHVPRVPAAETGSADPAGPLYGYQSCSPAPCSSLTGDSSHCYSSAWLD